VIGHSDTSTTLDIDSHLFDFDRQAADLRKKLAACGTARLRRRREFEPTWSFEQSLARR
jgi:hypothetical protein